MMKGLCHECFTPNVEIVIEKGQILCQNCFGKRYSKKSPENEESSIEKLKERWKRK